MSKPTRTETRIAELEQALANILAFNQSAHHRLEALEAVRGRQGVLRLADALVICDLKERLEALEKRVKPTHSPDLPPTWGHMNFTCDCKQCKATAEVNRLAREIADNELAWTDAEQQNEGSDAFYEKTESLLVKYRAALAREKGEA